MKEKLTLAVIALSYIPLASAQTDSIGSVGAAMSEVANIVNSDVRIKQRAYVCMYLSCLVV